MNFAQKLPAYAIGAGLLLGALALIGLWYLALFVFALVIFIILMSISRRQRARTERDLSYRPGKEIPAHIWALSEDALETQGPTVATIDLVELEKYRDNWIAFRDKAQVQHSGAINVMAPLLCFQTPTGDRGIVVAHERLVLGEMRRLDLDTYFDPLWKAGGVAKVGCEFTFDDQLSIVRASFTLGVFNTSMGEEPPETGAWAAWKILWRGVQGKS